MPAPNSAPQSAKRHPTHGMVELSGWNRWSQSAGAGARHGGDPAAAGRFADAWRAEYSPSMEEVRSGRRPFTRLDVLHRENLEKILPRFGIPPAAVPETELAELNLCWHRLDPWPDTVAGL